MLAVAVLTGRILFAGLPVPGAVVTASNGAHTIATTSDADGAFRLADLEDGEWTLRVQMRGFVEISRNVTVPAAADALTFTLTMRPYGEIVAAASSPPPAEPDVAGLADENVFVDVINGSVVNGAATPFAQPRAFGNNRPRIGAKYVGLVSGVFADSAWNARPFSFGGGAAAAPFTGDAQFGFILGGPLRIPGIVRNGPQMEINVQHGILRTATSVAAIVPTLAERRGEFPEFEVPADQISPQAQALLAYYPRPNTATAHGANYLTTLANRTTRDAAQFSVSSQAGRRSTMSTGVAWHRTRSDSQTLFGFRDADVDSTIGANASWQRRIHTRSSARLRYQFTDSGATLTPFFANRINVSGDAGIQGASQSPQDWGPPSLSFPDVAGLRDANYRHIATVTHAAGGEYLVQRGRHDVTVGGDVNRTGVDVTQQADPRGTLAFTGAVTGVPFADFVLGIPAASTIGLGSPSTHLHGESYDAYVTDDWRLSGLTLNLGVRWEYETPFVDTSDLLKGFVHGDARGMEPRLGASWRPVPGASLVIRASYGVYRNLGLYQPVAILLAGQPPFSRTFSVQNTPAIALSLASPFPERVPNMKTFAVDPDFRPAQVQNWAVSVQRDLPGATTVMAGYLGAKGSNLTQASLPNSYPPGGENPCASCTSGYVFLTSGGRAFRHAAQFTIRRRLHAGFTAIGQYTLSKSIDDAATFSDTTLTPGSLAVAQDWRDLSAERGPSSFDQRHVVTAQIQYTTGVGLAGGSLVDGVWGSIYKDWTLATQMTAGSGLPFTPVSFATVSGTGFVGIRPQLTGVPPVPAPRGAYASPSAYTTPAPGTWGNAGRNSIRGPAQFTVDASVARVFRLRGKTSLEWRIAATNVLNRVTFSAINTSIASPQFALPTAANPMRHIQLTVRYRF